jgi:hypothetical protein
VKVIAFHLIKRLRLSRDVTLDFGRCVNGVHTGNFTFYIYFLEILRIKKAYKKHIIWTVFKLIMHLL